MKINSATEVAVSQSVLPRPAPVADPTSGVARVTTPVAAVSIPSKDNGDNQATKSRVPNAESVRRTVEEMQKRVNAVAPELQFSIDETSGRSIIKVTDRTTNEVIRQIPTEETLQINKELERFQQGWLLNRKA